MPFALRHAFVATSALLAVPAGYVTVLTAAGLLARRRRPARDGAPTRFAILVPAHDEEAVIGDALASFTRLDYPATDVQVHVVADHCRDRTVEIVRAAGYTAHDRADDEPPGKGPALNWLFDRLVAAGEEFDAVLIVDADTTLEPGFLTAIDRTLRAGAQVAQGYYSVSEPDPSPMTSLRYAALACRHRLRPLGRTRLGGSAGLYGNGMAFRREVLATRRWSGHLVEDAELQNELLLDGILVEFVGDAVLHAEMPTTAAAARSQNERWERGRIELARRYVPRLVRALPRARGRRRAYADAILDHVTPPISALVAGHVAAGSVAALGALAGVRGARPALAVQVAAIAAVGAHTVVGLASAGAQPRHYRALLGAPRAVVWKTGLWLKVLSRRADVQWTRTRRNAEERP